MPSVRVSPTVVCRFPHRFLAIYAQRRISIPVHYCANYLWRASAGKKRLTCLQGDSAGLGMIILPGQRCVIAARHAMCCETCRLMSVYDRTPQPQHRPISCHDSPEELHGRRRSKIKVGEYCNSLLSTRSLLNPIPHWPSLPNAVMSHCCVPSPTPTHQPCTAAFAKIALLSHVVTRDAYN